MLIAGNNELCAQRVGREALTLTEEERVPGDIGGWRDSIKRSGGRDHKHIHACLLTIEQPIERFEALRDEILMRREDVVGQRLPVGKQASSEGAVEVRN